MPDNRTDSKTAEGTKEAGGTPGPPGAQKSGSGPDTASQGQASDKSSTQETFPRSYVEELRKESAGYRDRAKQSDELARRLVTSYAASTNRLVDPGDLAYTDELLGDDGYPDQAKVTAAVDELVRVKPYLASRRPPVVDIGQGAQDETTESVSFGSLLRAGVA